MSRLDFGAAEDFFWESFRVRGELGASLSVWKGGREMLSLAGGIAQRAKGSHPERPWSESTPVLVWSATKGPAAACLLHALERHGVPLSTPVGVFWPEFRQAGKEGVTFAHALAHQAGVPALDRPVSVLDHEAVADALAAQQPFWVPGEAHGYHPRTYGALLDELVRRVDGAALADYWRTWFAQPLGLDFWIGLPPEAADRVAPIHPPQMDRLGGTGEAGTPRRDTDFYRAFSDKASLTARAFQSPRGLESVLAMNKPEVRTASLPAFGGIGTAHALGKFYAMLANDGVIDGIRVFQSVEALIGPQAVRSVGYDRVLLRETAYTAGFMRDPLDGEGRKVRSLFGPSPSAFGQPGAGGSHAFADPENNVAFAYVMNQMEPGVMPNAKSLGAVDALYRRDSAQ